MFSTQLGRGRATTVRGGSWNNNQNNARCAYRNRNTTWNDNNNLGFRLMVSIAFSGPANPDIRRCGAAPESQPGSIPVAP